MVLTIATEKGGTGKSTIASNLAVVMARNGSDLLLIDGDPQRSLSKFVAVRDEEGLTPQLSCVQLLREAIVSEVRKIKDKYDDLIIDVVGRDDAGFRAALLVADIAVIPLMPSQFDYWVCEELPAALEQARIFNPGLKAIAVLNGCDTNPRVKAADDTAALLEDIKGITLAKTRIGYRRAFKKAPELGRAVCELTGADKSFKALMEIHRLYEEVTHASVTEAQD